MANDDYLSEVETRLHDVLAQGRGVSGSLGSEAQARAIVAGTFRRVLDNAALEDASTPPELFDRAYVLRFDGLEEDPIANNPFQGPQFHRLTLTVRVGYLGAVALSGAVDARGTETTAGAVVRADRRAISDGRRISRALRFPDLRGLDTNPAMVEGTFLRTSVIDLGGGRVIGETTMRVVLQSDETTAYGP